MGVKGRAVVVSSAVAGAFLLRNRHMNRRHAVIHARIRRAAIGAMMVVGAEVTRWRGVRSLTKKFGMTLIGRALH